MLPNSYPLAFIKELTTTISKGQHIKKQKKIPRSFKKAGKIMRLIVFIPRTNYTFCFAISGTSILHYTNQDFKHHAYKFNKSLKLLTPPCK
jgi:hypothetical protein